ATTKSQIEMRRAGRPARRGETGSAGRLRAYACRIPARRLAGRAPPLLGLPGHLARGWTDADDAGADGEACRHAGDGRQLGQRLAPHEGRLALVTDLQHNGIGEEQGMSGTSFDKRNADQIAYWNGPAGRRWGDWQGDLEALLRPITRTAIERAAVQPGARIVDIGCGCGAMTIEFGKRVGTAGRVLGIDI